MMCLSYIRLYQYMMEHQVYFVPRDISSYLCLGYYYYSKWRACWLYSNTILEHQAYLSPVHILLFVYCWANTNHLYKNYTTLYKWYTNVLCLLGVYNCYSKRCSCWLYPNTIWDSRVLFEPEILLWGARSAGPCVKLTSIQRSQR